MAEQDSTPTTATAVVVLASAPVYAVAMGGQVYEASDQYLLAPVVGDPVLVDWLASAKQYLIVAIVV